MIFEKKRLTSREKKIKQAKKEYKHIKWECIRKHHRGCVGCIYKQVYGCCPFLGLPYNWRS